MIKLQITIEFIILLAIIIMIVFGFFYFYIPSINNQKPTQSIIISNFQIDNVSYTLITCNVILSFETTSDTFTKNQINILAQNYTGTQFNISAYVDNFSYYLTPENNYQFNYNVTVSNTPFCNMFTEFITSKTGEITGLLLSVNKTKELYQFNPPIKTTSQQ